MLIFYPKLSRHDFGAFRIRGPGLGNLLFPWSRSVIYASQNGGRAFAPTWRQIKVSTFLKRESDGRTYGQLFRHRSLGTVLGGLRLRLTLPQVTEQQFLNGAVEPGRNDTLVVVKGFRGFFAPLHTHHDLLRHQLTSIVRQAPSPVPPFVAAHIRVGDFHPPQPTYHRNQQIELDWYLDEFSRVRTLYPDLPLVIFTNDTTGEVQQRVSGVQGATVLTGKRNAAHDLLLLSRAEHIVLSNSTFSLWAAFLGRGTLSTKFTELFADHGAASPNIVARMR